MILLNFAHPLTPALIEQIARLTGSAPDEVRDVRAQFDLEQPFAPQIVALLNALNISTADWQTQAWLCVLPSLNYAAGVLLAELHGRSGHFPAIVRLKPSAGALVTTYEIAEIINLEAVRAEARTRR